MGMGSDLTERRGPAKAMGSMVKSGMVAVKYFVTQSEEMFLPLARIAAGECVPANNKNIGEHLEAVAQHADFCSGRMRPAHGDFRGAQAVMASQVQQFRVEAETLDTLLGENYFAGFAPESFEAALGVDEGEAQTKTHHVVEDDSGEFAEGRLMRADQAAIDGARTDGHVEAVVHRRQELVGLLDGGGEIRVAEERDASASLQHSVADAEAFPAIDAIRNDAHGGQFVEHGLRSGHRAVG